MKRQVIVLPEEEFVDYIGPAGSLSYNRDRKIAHSHDGVTRGGKPIGGLGTAPPEDESFYGLYRGRWVPIDVEKKTFPTGPGPRELIAGDEQAGFYGEMSASELISGERLALAVGLSDGIPIGGEEAWLKFIHQERVLFIAKRPLRHSINWNSIDAAQSARGNRTVAINGFQFKIRLMTGGNGSPATGPGGEWNDLIYPIHVADPLGRAWAAYTNTDLGIGGYIDGSATWCVESGVGGATLKVIRGRASLTDFIAISLVNSGSLYSWRPVLELVKD